MLIEATEKATGRTKSVINQHSNDDGAHDLRIVAQRDLSIYDGERCTFFRCKCSWFGWLPNKEWRRSRTEQSI